MRSVNRLAEGEGDEPRRERAGASGRGRDATARETETEPETETVRPSRRPSNKAKDAARRHRRTFDESLKSLRESARFADNVRTLFGAHAPSVISDASLTRLQQILTERLVQRDGENQAVELKTGELSKLSKMVESAIDARHRLEQIRQNFEEARRAVSREGDAAAHNGTDGMLVVNRVKQLLGVPLGPETEEEAAAAERQFVPFDLTQLENSSPAGDLPPEIGAGAAVAPGL